MAPATKTAKKKATPKKASAIVGLEAQPVSSVEWVKRDALHSNDYNPNHVARPELRLLKRSIMADGWTHPIVAHRSGEIVDGFHRWTVAGDVEIAAMTDGLVPVVYLRAGITETEAMASTIRHNRARGVHGVKPMAQIVRKFLDESADPGEELGMEREEVQRLGDAAGMPERISRTEKLGKGWVPG